MDEARVRAAHRPAGVASVPRTRRRENLECGICPLRPLEQPRIERGSRTALRGATRGYRPRSRHGAHLFARGGTLVSPANPRGDGTRSMNDLALAAEIALAAALEASETVMRVYTTPFGVQYKGKNDPVTLADHEANALLCERLCTTYPR